MTQSYDLNTRFLALPGDLAIIGFDEQGQPWVIASTRVKGDATAIYGFDGKDWVFQKKISYEWRTNNELPCCVFNDTAPLTTSQRQDYSPFLEISNSDEPIFIKDKQGNIWAGTDAGLVHFSSEFQVPAPARTTLHVFLASGGYWFLGILATIFYFARALKNGIIDLIQVTFEKHPTIWHILGLGAFIGLFLGPQNFLFDRQAGDPLIRFFLPGQFGLTVAILEVGLAIAGAMIGQKKATSMSGKWLWLWLGALIGTWLPLPIVALFWMLFIGGY